MNVAAAIGVKQRLMPAVQALRDARDANPECPGAVSLTTARIRSIARHGTFSPSPPLFPIGKGEKWEVPSEQGSLVMVKVSG